MKTVHVGLGDWRSGSEDMFKKHGWALSHSHVKGHPDLVCFMGGADVSPELYGEKALPCTFSQKSRDDYDRLLFDKYLMTPKVGICRGGQVLNVFSGGRMWQDTNNHGGTHDIVDVKEQRLIPVSSTHHQMMRPSDKAVVVATCKRSDYVKAEKEMLVRDKDNYEDIEVLFYPHTKSLCYQPHPEIGPPENEEYFFYLLNKYLGV